MNPLKIKILILEDNPADAELMQRELRRGGIVFDSVRTEEEKGFREKLEKFAPDVVLSDYSLPSYNGADAMLATSDLRPETLFIYVSGVMDEEAAVEALKQGATDYILKDHLQRLPSVVEKAIRTRDEERLRRQAEASLAESEKRFRSLAESAFDAITTSDSNGNVAFWNQSAERIFGYTAEEIIGKPVITMVPKELYDFYRKKIGEVNAQRGSVESGRTFESVGVRKDNAEVPLEISLSPWEAGDEKYITAIIRDVSERKRAEESIRRMNRSLLVLSGGNEALVRATDETDLLADVCRVIVETGGYRMAWVGYREDGGDGTVKPVAWAGHEDGFLDAVTISLNNPLQKGCPTVQAINSGKPVLASDFSDLICEPWRSEVNKRGYKSCIALPLINGPTFGAVTLYTGDKLEFDQEEVGLLTELAKDLSYGISSLRDREKRIQAQQALAESEARYRGLFQTSPDAIILCDLSGKIMVSNAQAASLAGYSSTSELAGLDVIRAVIPDERKAAGKDLERLLAGEKVESLHHYYRKDGSVYPGELTAAPILDSEGKPAALIAILRDVTERLRVESEIKKNLAMLQQFTSGIIQAMALTVETRDPYTAGHQRRVSDLAAAIAVKMGISAHELEGIRTAGAIHDLGKIHIPSEILSKPGQLTPLERGIIETHPQVGYEILSEIDFPWPIAEIVLQHHERIDGTGYPRGLSRQDILLEARILSVADVVEAMSSHRPYRPALGIHNALIEISENRGALYDEEAVDACLKLFNEEDFEFDRTSGDTLAPVA